MRWQSIGGAILVVGLLASCGGDQEPVAAPEASGRASAVSGAAASAAEPSATQTTTVSPSAVPSESGTTCDPFGSTTDLQSSDPLALSTMTGATMRVGRHACFDRFVFQMRGSGSAPGWTVGYRDPLVRDGSGTPVDLRGDAALSVVVGVWTVNDFEGRPAEWPPFTGPDAILTTGFEALKEARNLYAFEGTTQIGLGVDRERPFRVSWLDDPARLVVDIYTG